MLTTTFLQHKMEERDIFQFTSTADFIRDSTRLTQLFQKPHDCGQHVVEGAKLLQLAKATSHIPEITQFASDNATRHTLKRQHCQHPARAPFIPLCPTTYPGAPTSRTRSPTTKSLLSLPYSDSHAPNPETGAGVGQPPRTANTQMARAVTVLSSTRHMEEQMADGRTGALTDAPSHSAHSTRASQTRCQISNYTRSSTQLTQNLSISQSHRHKPHTKQTMSFIIR